MRRLLRADLSGPVLAIIITVAIIAAGIGLVAYFWWLAPQAGKTPALVVVGEPALLQDNGTWHLYMTVKNTGTEDINITKVIIEGNVFNGAVNQIISAGDKVDLDITNSTAITITGPSVEGVLVTDGGVYPFSAYVAG
jgi:hypothetical protein